MSSDIRLLCFRDGTYLIDIYRHYNDIMQQSYHVPDEVAALDLAYLTVLGSPATKELYDKYNSIYAKCYGYYPKGKLRVLSKDPFKVSSWKCPGNDGNLDGKRELTTLKRPYHKHSYMTKYILYLDDEPLYEGTLKDISEYLEIPHMANYIQSKYGDKSVISYKKYTLVRLP